MYHWTMVRSGNKSLLRLIEIKEKESLFLYIHVPNILTYLPRASSKRNDYLWSNPSFTQLY